MPTDPARQLRNNQTGGELAMIEFQTHLPPPRSASSADLADNWLEGPSRAVERLRARATTVGREGQAVAVIQGEAGAGKLRVAQWIHRCGSRANSPMMVIDAAGGGVCSQLERVIGSLRTEGELAPGTLAIRNIEEAPAEAIQLMLELLTVQGVALRCGLVLLSRMEVTELRARSLQHGQLLGRAANSIVLVPPLRSRSGDVTYLARRFVQDASKRYGRTFRGISPQALTRLEQHEFPGNIHELRAMVDQAVLRGAGDWLTADCFPGIGKASDNESDPTEIVIRMPGSSLREIEAQALKLALRLSGGRVVRASELLGITRHALRRKLEKFGLNGLRQHYEQGPDIDPITGQESVI